MKQFFATAICMFIFVSAAHAEPVDSTAISQEAQRNRELLDIWKEHVKSLTHERDEAYKELESLRASNRVHAAAPATAPLGQFGMESQAVPAAAINRDLQMQFSALQSQFQSTKKELDELKSKKEKAPAKTAVKIPANRLEDMQQRINELQADNESLNRALAGAQKDGGSTVSRVRQLEAELQQTRSGSADMDALRTENQELHDQIADLKSQQPKGFISSGGQASDTVSRERDAFMRQSRKLQYENDTLKVQIEKMKVIEKELQSTRSYFGPMVQDLQDKNAKLNEENEQLKAQVQKTQSDAQSSIGSLESIAKENEQLKSDIQNLKKSEEESDQQMERIKSQLQSTSADKDKLKNLEEEIARMAAEKKILEKSYYELQADFRSASVDKDRIKNLEEELASAAVERKSLERDFNALQANYKSQDEQFQQVSQQMSAMQRASEEWKGKESQFSGNLSSLQDNLSTLQEENQALRAERTKLLRTAERYQASLKANFTDMQNLKSNFEAYLESLVASFQDRQK